MFKKLINWLLMAIIMAVPTGAAFALPSDQAQEQIIKQEVIVGYFDAWKGSNWLDTNNDGTPDVPGQTNKGTKPFDYSAEDKLSEWQITRVEVTYPFEEEEYTSAGGRQYGPDGKPAQMNWEAFNRNYLKYLPKNLTAQIATSLNLNTGTASVQWGLDLIELNQGGTLDLKDPENRKYIGYEPADIGNMVEGWRWYLPAIITWYGVPKQVIQPPDFSVTLDRYEFQKMNPGDKITLTATYKLNANHPQPERAKLGALHVVGASYPVVLEPLNPGNALDNEGVIEFNPGESKQYKIAVTVQNRNSVVQAKVWPADTSIDADWSNNRAEAQIRLNQNLWTEPISNTELGTTEGNSINATARIHNDSGSMIVTRVVWTLDGKIIKDIKDYDVISQEDTSITVTPGVGEHNLTVEVNPDKNKPVDEATFTDNKTTYTINVTPQREELSGDIQIIGPDIWDCYKEQKTYSFTVKISGYLPYERYRNSNGHIRYRSKTYNMTVKTHGEGVETYKWTPTNQFGNPQLTRPVVKSWSESYSESSGSFTKSFNYRFPSVGMRGFSDSTLVIEATDSRFGTARKVVTIKPYPVKIPDYKLTL